MKIKRNVLTCLVFPLFISFSGFTQEYLEGYIILNDGDTIYGKIKKQSELKSCEKVYIIDSTSVEKKYKSKKAIGYKRGDEIFIKKNYTVPGNLGTYNNFMKVIETGKVVLYEAYSNVYQSSGGGGGVSTTRHDYFLEKNGNLLRVKKGGFKNQISEYFRENKELSEKIKNKELGYGDMHRIVQIYNMDFEL